MTDVKINLVVVAHPDDEILGFGGAGARLAASGEIVQPVILCGMADARLRRPTDQELIQDMFAANERVAFAAPILGDFPNIRMNNVDHLDMVQFVEKQVLTFQPHRIFTHHPADLNDDHKQIFGATCAAARLFQRRDDVRQLEALMLMEIPSSTDWGFNGRDATPFLPDTFVEIADYIDAKIAALGCYRNVMRPPPHARSEEAIRGLSIVRGSQAGYKHAEAFQTLFRTTLG